VGSINEVGWVVPHSINGVGWVVPHPTPPHPTPGVGYLRWGGLGCTTPHTVENYIFNGNLPSAIDLTKENLDWCCSGDLTNAQFKRVHATYRLMLQWH
jgi:hypothetical protein